MNYVRFHIQISNDLQELAIADLFEYGFEGFEQETNLLKASISAVNLDETKRKVISSGLNKYDASILDEELIKPQNWNQKWEETIQPKVIGNFFIKPTWSDVAKKEDHLTEILIDPKMAFGTGYHETTKLMLEWISEIDVSDKTILDAGTGTGILGIAALKRGAKSVFGFDIDEWSETNAKENIALNQVIGFEVKLGSTEVIPENASFDLIFANINKNALKSLIIEFSEYLNGNGSLLLSGLLIEDEQEMLYIANGLNFTHQETKKEGEWISIHLTR